MAEITLVLPYPPSANVYWRTRVVKPRQKSAFVHTYVSPEAQAFKREVAQIAFASGIRKALAGRVEVEYTLYPNLPNDWKRRAQRDPLGWDDSVLCIDLDNATKVLLDALKHVAMEDDRWVRRIVAQRAEPDGEARLVVTVRQIVAGPAPQLDLLSEVAANETQVFMAAAVGA